MRIPLSRLLLLACLASLGACGTRDRRQLMTTPPPRAEFLVATQDSTFWVRADPSGIRVRGAPLTLAQFDNRFYEIFLADDDRSYENALLVGLRLYRRDLSGGDSTVVFEDTIVPRLAREYGRAHPAERPLAPDEDGADDPPTQALADLEIVGVDGPYLSYEYHVDVTNRGADQWHATRRGVIDLRSGRSLRVSDLVPAPAAASVVAGGKRELSTFIDSVRAESGGGGPGRSPNRAARAVADFRFDERSFVITVPDSQPAIEFGVPQRGVDAPDDIFALDALPVPNATWWPAIASGFPMPSGDLDRWPRFAAAGYDLVARYDSTAENARLSLSDHKHEWPIRVVAAPILHVFWLDQPPIDSAQRRALGRAFDEASLYDETTRTVLDRRAQRRTPSYNSIRGRGVPNGAKFRTALSPKQRGVPKSAESRTALSGAECRGARSAECDKNAGARRHAVAPFGALFGTSRRLALFGTSRRSELSGVRNLALFGSSRRLGFRAVWSPAPFGIPRRLGFRALCSPAPFGTPRPPRASLT